MNKLKRGQVVAFGHNQPHFAGRICWKYVGIYAECYRRFVPVMWVEDQWKDCGLANPILKHSEEFLPYTVM